MNKSDVVAGLPAPIARDFLRHFARGAFASRWGKPRLDPLYGTEIDALVRLQATGFVQSEIRGSGSENIWWTNTIDGNAMSMAKFSPLITRSKADELLAGAVERAQEFNEDPAKLATILRIRAFGSYVNTDEDRLGDLDLGISITRRGTFGPQVAREYARASGRAFPDYISELSWATHEPRVVVKNRSRGISLTRENSALLTGRWTDVYVADGVTPGVADDWSET